MYSQVNLLNLYSHRTADRCALAADACPLRVPKGFDFTSYIVPFFDKKCKRKDIKRRKRLRLFYDCSLS